MGDRPKCAKFVATGGVFSGQHCSRYALPGQKYCKQHSPEYMAEQDRKWRQRLEAKLAARKAAEERNAVALLRRLGYTVIAPGPSGGDTDA